MGRFENTGAQAGNGSVQQEMKRARRTGWRDVIICLVIIVVALLIQESRDPRAISLRLSPDEEKLTVLGPDAAEHALVFADVESVELFTGLQELDRGEQLSGESTKTLTSGRFRSDAFGEYELHVMNKLHNYIVARGADGTLVFNFESDETTKVIYDYICEHISPE